MAVLFTFTVPHNVGRWYRLADPIIYKTGLQAMVNTIHFRLDTGLLNSEQFDPN